MYKIQILRKKCILTACAKKENPLFILALNQNNVKWYTAAM